MTYEPTTFYGLIGLVIINLSAIINSALKERKRNRSQKKNGASLEEVKVLTKNIDTKVDNLNINMAQLSTEVKGIKNNCRQTTRRFEKGINENRRDILEVVKAAKKS